MTSLGLAVESGSASRSTVGADGCRPGYPSPSHTFDRRRGVAGWPWVSSTRRGSQVVDREVVLQRRHAPPRPGSMTMASAAGPRRHQVAVRLERARGEPGDQHADQCRIAARGGHRGSLRLCSGLAGRLGCDATDQRARGTQRCRPTNNGVRQPSANSSGSSNAVQQQARKRRLLDDHRRRGRGGGRDRRRWLPGRHEPQGLRDDRRGRHDCQPTSRPTAGLPSTPTPGRRRRRPPTASCRRSPRRPTWAPTASTRSPRRRPSKVNPPRTGKVPTDPHRSASACRPARARSGCSWTTRKAPCTVNSFVSLAQQGYFNDTPCHRLTTAPTAVGAAVR